MTKPNKYWTLVIVLMIVIIATGSLIIRSRSSQNQPIEISIPPSHEIHGEVYIAGAVNNPGFYPLKAGDSLDDIIRAAGNTTTGSDLNRLKIYIPMVGEEESPQKVDINQAETWLLQSLPGIGESKAQAIIDYRHQNGRFRHTNELTRIEGIGTTTYEKIAHLITVAD